MIVKLLKLLFIIFLTSCSVTATLIKSKRNVTEINQIVIIDINSTIYTIQHGNNQVFNKYLSDSLKPIIVEECKSIFPDKEIFSLSIDSLGKSVVLSEVNKVIMYEKEGRDVSNITFSSRMDSVLISNHIKFAMIIDYGGYTRIGNNYSNQKLLGVALTVASLGNGYIVPNTPASSETLLKVVLIDQEF